MPDSIRLSNNSWLYVSLTGRLTQLHQSAACGQADAWQHPVEQRPLAVPRQHNRQADADLSKCSTRASWPHAPSITCCKGKPVGEVGLPGLPSQPLTFCLQFTDLCGPGRMRGTGYHSSLQWSCMPAGGCAQRSWGHPDGCSDPVVQQVAETERVRQRDVADAALPTLSATSTSPAGMLQAVRSCCCTPALPVAAAQRSSPGPDLGQSLTPQCLILHAYLSPHHPLPP